MDECAYQFEKVFFECGTKGVGANVQIIIPHYTKRYIVSESSGD